MLQYRLSTLFLIFFVVATTMALFGAWGIWIAGVLFLAAICVNRAKRLANGTVLASFLIFAGIICPGLISATEAAHLAARRLQCLNNLRQLGLALRQYEAEHGHFPSVYTFNQSGKPVFSWVFPLLPYFEYKSVYNQLKKNEPWDCPQNKQIFDQTYFQLYHCPSVNRNDNRESINYIALIGPATVWRDEGNVKFSDLPDGGSHTVALVEVADSGKHWAEPFAVTVDNLLENTRTSKGVRISSYHPSGVPILTADGEFHVLPTHMPLSLWRRILNGEVSANDLDNIQSLIDSNAPDMVDVYVGTPNPKPWTIILGVVIWLVSVGLLFQRAVKSRKKAETVTAIQPNEEKGGLP
jgi:hypothetical protein